jgi:hypothetical protein
MHGIGIRTDELAQAQPRGQQRRMRRGLSSHFVLRPQVAVEWEHYAVS